ncbi:hypothetical protein ACOMHN_030752 [Nucella lapillus]
MADAEEDSGCNVKDSGDARRTRAPSRKKFDEEMEGLTANIRRTEEELEELKTTGPSSFANAQKNLKAEKNANIERRKKIDADLERLNKDVSGMMHSISRLESTLHYRSEDKIDEAIRRLDWSLKVQNFKLSQEKKIVAEIDSLRRSKKTLIQYRNLKKDKDAMRDRQRRMREERDYYFHKVTQLKQREEKLRAENSGQRARVEQLKKELDSLYESKRQMLSMYKKQRDDFFDDREKRRHESFKKRQEEKQVLQAALRKEMLGVLGINKVMSLKRHNKITEYLHLVDNANQPDPQDPNRDRLFKVRPLLTTFISTHFFSSVALIEQLLANGTYACATVRTNSVGLSASMKRHYRVRKGEHIVYQRDSLLATVWHDKRDVNLLSTNTSHGQDTEQRWDNRARARVDVPCPTVVKLYNDHMGGVDKADQMRGHYSTLKTSVKCWRDLLSFVFDAAINNASSCTTRVCRKNRRPATASWTTGWTWLTTS